MKKPQGPEGWLGSIIGAGIVLMLFALLILGFIKLFAKMLSW